MHDDEDPTIDTGFEHIGDTEVIVNNDPDTQEETALPEEDKTQPNLPLRLSQFSISYTRLRAVN